MSIENVSKSQRNGIVLLRVLIGWHFMYEGVVKLHDPAWTSKGYLMSAEGWFSGFFAWLGSDTLVNMVDLLNVFGLMVVGITLIFGIWEKLGTIFGIALLLLYYLARPPFPGVSDIGTEGSYWIVNKNLIEAVALWLLYQLPSGAYFGIQRLFEKKVETSTLTNG